MGWRFQVPYLLSLGMQVIVPDMLGYGRTAAPEPATEYSLKKISAHMAHVIRAVTDEPVILGGHDWGAALAWRLAIYHPSLFRGIFCFSIPYFPPQPSVPSLEDVVAQNPFLQYQLQNASSEAENLATKSPAHLRGFLNAIYGGVTPDGLPGFDLRVGVIQDRLPHIGPSPFVAPEIMEYFGKNLSFVF
jgi:soluble epoxide hydrolase / lipid-phosphate phosphatase